jgi:hypothetical protein
MLAIMSPSHFMMLFILEWLCRDKSYCWPSNTELARLYGCTPRQVKTILGEMETLGYLWRVLPEPDARDPRTKRLGIFLHKRLNPDLPVEDRPPPPEAVARLWNARRASRDRTPMGSGKSLRSGEENFPFRGKKTSPRLGEENFPQNKDEVVSLNKDETEADAEAETDRIQRQRPDPLGRGSAPMDSAPEARDESGPFEALSDAQVEDLPAAAACTHAALEDPPAAAACTHAALEDPPAAAPALTPGQREFVGTLDAGQRAALDQMSSAKRAAVLAPHVDGLDPILAQFQARAELSQCSTGRSPPPLPSNTRELIQQLPRCGPEAVPTLAARLEQDFGRPEDRKLWGQFQKIAMATRGGSIDPAHVLKAYDHAMLPGVKKPGGYFWRALQDQAGVDADGLKQMGGLL